MTIVLLCLIAGLPLALLRIGSSRRYFGVLEPITAFYGGLFLVYVVPLTRHLGPAQALYGDGIVRAFLVAGLLLQVAYYFGYVASRTRRRLPSYFQHGSAGTLLTETSKISTRDPVLSRFTVAALTLGGLALVLEIQNAGGVAELLRSGGKIEDVDRAGTSANAFIMLFKPMFLLGLGAALFQMRSWRGQSLAGPLTVLFICAAIAYPLVIGSRSRLISISIFLVGSRYLGTGRRLPVLLLSISWGILFVAVANLVEARDRVRYSRPGDGLPVAEWVQIMTKLPELNSGAGVLAQLDKRQSSELNCSFAVIDYVAREGPIGITPVQEFGTRWIPRAIWSKKTYPAAESFTPFFRQANLGTHEVRTPNGTILVGPAFGALGYLYGMGGMLGVGIMGLLVGAIGGVLGSLGRGSGRPLDGFISTLLIATGLSDAIATPLFWVFSYGPSLLVLIFIARHTRWSAKRVKDKV